MNELFLCVHHLQLLSRDAGISLILGHLTLFLLQMKYLLYKTHPCLLGISALMFVLFDIQICRLQLKSSHVMTFTKILLSPLH